MVWIIVIGIIVIIALAIMSMYNALVRLRVQAENAWSDIDVQLKRRWDLIPNLVETVKGYAGHERQTLEAVVNARSAAMNAQGPAQKAEAEGILTGALKSLFALAEAYPQLRAVETFSQLQATLSQLEDAIQNARRYYNAVVRDLNTRIQVFPSNIIAGMFNFRERQFFEMPETERAVPQVKFDTPPAAGSGTPPAGPTPGV
jgi:LemA protein